MSRRVPETLRPSDPNARVPITLSLRWVTVEPSVFFVAFAMGMTLVANADLYVEKTCLEGSELFGNGTTYPERVCDNIMEDEFRDEERYVEYQVSRLGYMSAALQALPAMIFALFAGAWSDVYGRRFLIIFPLLGFLLLDGIAITLALVDGIPSDYLLFEAFQDLTGGFSVLLLGAFAHVSDTSTEKNRTTRMGILEFVYLLGLDLGVGISGPLYDLGGYEAIYALSAMMVVTGLLSVPWLLERPLHVRDEGTGEVVRLTEEQAEEADVDPSRIVGKGEKFGDFFKLDNVRRTLSAGLRPREEGRRHVVWLLIVIYGCIEFVSEGETIVDSLYIRDRHSFDDYDDFSDWWLIFYILFMTWGLLALGLMVPVMKQIYHLCDPVIIAVTAVGTFLRSLTFLLADNRDNLYIGGFVDLFNFAGMVACRSAVVSLVGKDEVGKVFAHMAVAQAAANVVAHLYSLLYEETHDWHDGLAYCINATIFTCIFFVALYLIYYFRKYSVEIWAREKKKLKTEEAMQQQT